MALASIVITGVTLAPNPVSSVKQFIVSLQIEQAIFVLGDDETRIMDNDGELIEVPDQAITHLADEDGAAIIDEDNSIIEIMEG